MTHAQRVDSLLTANILRLMNTRTGDAKPWDRDALRKCWPKIELEIALLSDPDF